MTIEVDQAIAELQGLVHCRCDPAYTDRGLHDPDCECDYASEVQVIVDYIEQLNANLEKVAALIEDAYCDGFAEGSNGTWVEGDYTKPWLRSDIYKNLKEITGDKDDQ
jgi:hypothetical protein